MSDVVLQQTPAGTPQKSTSHQPAPFLLANDPPARRGLSHLLIAPDLAKHIFRVALPVVMGMLTQTAINILDSVMVGRLPGTLANSSQSAIGLALPIMWLVGGFLSAIWVGTQAITSRRAGEGNDLLAGRALTNALVIALVGSATLATAAYLATPLLVPVLHRSPTVVNLGTTYIRVRLLGIPGMVATFAYKSFFDGLGRTRVFMVVALIMNITNAALNFPLIYGADFLGIPQLGARGAAIASVIATYLGLSLLIGWSCRPSLIARYHHHNPRNINRRVIGEIIRLSLPNSFATAVVMAGFIGFYWVVGLVDARHSPPGNPLLSTASQAVVGATMFGLMTALAFGMATAAIVSQCLGAKRPALAAAFGWEATKSWAYVIGLVGIGAALWPEPLLWLFNPNDNVIAAATPSFRMLALFQAPAAVAIIVAQTLYGVGSAKYVMLVEFVLHVFVMTPAAALFGLVLDLGLWGVYMGPILYITLLGIAMVWKFARGDWKDIVI